jgi:TatD DNase family protein
MPSDAHAHPYDLYRLDPLHENERAACGVACAASAWNEASFVYHEALARSVASSGAPPLVLCFGVHPQLPADVEAETGAEAAAASLEFLFAAVAAGRVRAIGEAGFDLFDARYRATEGAQERLFVEQLNLALQKDLPMILHIRRAMHRVFAYSRELARLPAVILHSYSGTAMEARSLLGRRVNAFFSFGMPVALNNKRAQEAAALLPLDRLLVETDAPYQKPRGAERSSWKDLAVVIRAVADLRAEAASAIERATDANFRSAYGVV